jgi:arylsulfatase A-like enzyme
MRLPSVIFLCWMTVTVHAAERPNIMLLVSDDQRPDTIHALGNDTIRTPNLDRLVAEGSTFTRATCANPICTPSRAEILTGCTGFRCGVVDFGGTIDPQLPTMSRWFGAAGYSTCYVGKWHNDGVPITRGYDFTNGLFRGGGAKFLKPATDYAGRPTTGYTGWIFQDDKRNLFPEKGVGLTPEISQHFADAAIEVINDAGEKPFFLHVNFTAPHDPLMLPPKWETAYKPEDMPLPKNFLAQHPFDHGNFDGRDEKLFQWPRTPEETRREIAAYYAVISHMDEQIGRIISAVEKSGKLENTIIVFSSDHGLGVGSHGLRGKQSMYEHTIGVPLIMRGPKIPLGDKFAAQCCLRDIFPTLCDLAGVPGPADKIDGKSLWPVLSGTVKQIHPFVTGYFRNVQRMIRTTDWKYIEYPEAKRQQLFHLTVDPDEMRNLIDEASAQDVRLELTKQMHEWFREQGDAVLAPM